MFEKGGKGAGKGYGKDGGGGGKQMQSLPGVKTTYLTIKPGKGGGNCQPRANVITLYIIL